MPISRPNVHWPVTDIGVYSTGAPSADVAVEHSTIEQVLGGLEPIYLSTSSVLLCVVAGRRD